MAFKRLIATIFVKDGVVVKSYNFNFWRPAGRLYSALINLDRWGVDEIIVIDISRHGRISSKTLDEIKKSNITTPLIYGGGIRSINDIHKLLAVGCDRFILETLLFNNEKELNEISSTVGKQALIASLPIITKNNNCYAFFTSIDNLLKNQSDSMLSLEKVWLTYCELPVSEILIIDADNEGVFNKFSYSIAEKILNFQSKSTDKKLIWFGGLGMEQSRALLDEKKTVGVAYGNVNFEYELNIMAIRALLRQGSLDQFVRHVSIT
jgi:cyclase